VLVNIFGDESSQNAHRYMVLGTIWENPVCAADFARDVYNLRRETGFHKEFHWADIKGHHVKAYNGLVEIFKEYMDQGMVKFRAIVVDQSDRRHKVYSPDDELHFYKMFYWMILKRLHDSHDYDIFLDRKSNSVPGRLSDLKNTINNAFANEYFKRHQRFRSDPIRRVEPRDGSQIELQLADIFAGAIAYCKNGSLHAATNRDKNPKVRVLRHMVDVIGPNLLMCHASNESPSFNVWCFTRK
jgi:hypothetical protein